MKDSSRMDISLNNQFLQSFNLSSKQEANRLLLRIPVLQGLLDGKTDVSIPALKLGATNQLRFDFEYMNPMPGGSVDNCITFQPVQNHVVIGDDSTIDFFFSRSITTSSRCRIYAPLLTRASHSAGWRICRKPSP